MKALTKQDVELVASVVDESGVVQTLEDAFRRGARGPRGRYNIRTFLIGALLSIPEKGNAHLTSIHETLTKDLPVDLQWDYDVRRHDEEGNVKVISKSELENVQKRIQKKLGYGVGADCSEEERSERTKILDSVVFDLLDATLPARCYRSYALDASGIWSWSRSKSGPASEKGCFDPDAKTGGKTAKSGSSEWFFGYDLHALVRVKDMGKDATNEAILIERVAVTAASTDVVEPSLRLLRSLRDSDEDGRWSDDVEKIDLLVDRHYSYKTNKRWGQSLRGLGVRQHLDLRKDETAFVDYNGMRMVGAVPHCPRTPERLNNLTNPGPAASLAEKNTFRDRVEVRQQWALQRTDGPDVDGVQRYRCPALSGTIGCPGQPGTTEVAVTAGLEIVVDPPTGPDAPACCSQQKVTIQPNGQTKLIQEHYWGSRKWEKRYSDRTYVEGVFGTLKNRNTECIKRGFIQTVGIEMATFWYGMAAVSFNIRTRRRWSLQQLAEGVELDSDDLFAKPQQTFHGLAHLTEEQRDEIDGNQQTS
jgi:hypothetical protein